MTAGGEDLPKYFKEYLDEKFGGLDSRISILQGGLETQTRIFSDKLTKNDDSLRKLASNVKTANDKVEHLDKIVTSNVNRIAVLEDIAKKIKWTWSSIVFVGAPVMTFLSLLMKGWVDKLLGK